MRSRNRISAFTILFRFLFLGALPAVLVYFVFGLTWTVYFFGVMTVLFTVLWWATNTVVSSYTPEYYDALKAGGGDPFLDNVGWPLNTDSEPVRQQLGCPQCGAPLHNLRCPNCDPPTMTISSR